MVRMLEVSFAIGRFCARVGIGLLGVYLLIAGVVGVVVDPFLGAWLSLVGAGVVAFVGWVLAYGAFKRWPWETFTPAAESSDTRSLPARARVS